MEPRCKLTCRLPRKPRSIWPLSAARIALVMVLGWFAITAITVIVNDQPWP